MYNFYTISNSSTVFRSVFVEFITVLVWHKACIIYKQGVAE